MEKSTFKTLIIDIVLRLFKSRSVVTTLDIKNQFRLQFPDENCTQSDVSITMIEIADTKALDLGFNDTGVYREYFMINNPAPTPVTPTTTPVNTTVVSTPTRGYTRTLVTRSQLVDIIRDGSKGRFFTINWDRNDGTNAEYNGKVSKKNFMSNLGYINFKTSKGEVKQINPKTIKFVILNNTVHAVR